MLLIGRGQEGSARLAETARVRLGARGWLRALHGLALLVTLAGIAHLLTVLLVPRYAAQDAGSIFLGLGADGQAELVPRGERGATLVADADSLTAISVCGFDLDDGPLRVSARTGSLPLALSVHLRGGGVYYAVTDKAAQRGVLEFVVLNREQFEDRVSRDDEGEGPRELRVVTPARQGIVVARALVRQPSDRVLAEALVSAVACGGAG